MSAAQVDVSVIVVSWNTRDLLARCLRSVCDALDGLSVETMVVDNASTDGSVGMVRECYPDVKLIANSENLGFVRANNQALAVSQGKYVLLLNSDAALLPGALEHMVRFLTDQPTVGIVGPKFLNPDGSFQSSYMSFPSLLSELLLMTKLHRIFRTRWFPSHPPWLSEEAKAVDWMLGACMMIRRDTLDDIGGMDETFFMYSEEVDWCWRAKQAGWAVYYLPEAQVVHDGGQSSAKVPVRRRSMVYRSKYLFLEKHYGPATAHLFQGALLITSALKMVFWSLSCLSPRAPDRVRAMDSVRSYGMLIGQSIRF